MSPLSPVKRAEANSHTRGTLPSEEEDRTRDQPDDPSKGIEQEIDEKEDPCEEAHRAVGVSTEGHLREELPDEKDQQRTETDCAKRMSPSFSPKRLLSQGSISTAVKRP